MDVKTLTVQGIQKVVTSNHNLIVEGKVEISIKEVIEAIQEIIEKQIKQNVVTKKDSLYIADQNVYGYDWHPHSGYYNREVVRTLSVDEWAIMNSVLSLRKHFTNEE